MVQGTELGESLGRADESQGPNVLPYASKDLTVRTLGLGFRVFRALGLWVYLTLCFQGPYS